MSLLLSLLIPVAIAAPAQFDACVYEVATPHFSYSAIVKKAGGCKNGRKHFVPALVCSSGWTVKDSLGVNQCPSA